MRTLTTSNQGPLSGPITDEDIIELNEAIGKHDVAENMRFSRDLKEGKIGVNAGRPPRRIA